MKQLYSPTPEHGHRRRTLRRALFAALLSGSLPAAAQSTALQFDGATKYVQATSVNLSGSALSLEAWVKVNAFKTVFPYISSIAGVEDGNAAALLRFGDAGTPANKLQFVLTVGTTQLKLTSAATFSPNTWYHVAATYDGTTMKIYVNGLLDGSLGAVGTAAGAGAFSIGRNYENGRVLNGAIDEVRVWTRVLTPAEVLANRCSVDPAAVGLEAYWPLNEGSGAVAVDRTGNGHDGTLLNMASTDWSTAVPGQCVVTAVQAPRPAAALGVQVLGNPAAGEQTELEIRGAQGQPVRVQLLNSVGAVVREQLLTPAAPAQRSPLALPAAAGLYVVRVSTTTGTATTRLLRQ